MLIRLGYDIQFAIPVDVAMVAMLHVHPSRERDLREPDEVHIDPPTPVEEYMDSFGNRCTRFLARAGTIRLYNSTLIHDSGELEEEDLSAPENRVEDLPTDVLQYLLPSRYCEVELLSNIAAQLFGHLPHGWSRVRAVCDWVYNHVTFGYPYARNTRTAWEVYNEQVGVCRDFQHLAVTLCRCLNIPARYVTGYLGDIGIPLTDTPMDFSAWFEVYLGNRWWAFDARHNRRRIGRILMAAGRDAADVALTTSFGSAPLLKFEVVSDEVVEQPALTATAGSDHITLP